MSKLAIPKIPITEEMKQTHNELKSFLKRNPEIVSKIIYPIGHSVDISTIPEHLEEEFLNIVCKNKT